MNGTELVALTIYFEPLLHFENKLLYVYYVHDM